MSTPRPVLTAVDDWLVHVLLEDGRVYLFQTEMWPSHHPPYDSRPGDGPTNWTATRAEAELAAIFCAERNADPFCAEVDPTIVTNECQLLDICSRACHAMSDYEFRRRVR